MSGKSCAASRGFTLLEVILTILLVTGGFVVLLQALNTGLFVSSDNESQLVAVNLAQEKAEDIRNTTYASIANEAKAVVPGFTTFQRDVVVTTPQTDLKQATITVYWNSKDVELDYSVVTYVSNA